MSRPPDYALIGRTIAGKYEISEYIGGGGMGAVYRAHQASIDKDVALKVMHPEMASDPKFAERFQREARAASRLDHVNSMRVMDFGQEPDGILYIVMELLDGRSLLDVVRDEPLLADERIVSILSQVLAALAVAHGMGIVHRDLKPENVMILAARSDDGDSIDLVKVCDFGIAKLADPRSDEDKSERAKAKLTSQGMMIGTPEYMSPEQARGDPLDARSDLYSVGVILFQLITGRIPFEGETALGIALKHVTDEAPLPSALNPKVSPSLEALCLKAMKKQRDERYATAREMRADLRNALSATSRVATGPELQSATTLPGVSASADPVVAQRARLQAAETMLTPQEAGVPATRDAAAGKGTVAGTSSVIRGAATGESARASSRIPWVLAIVAALGAGGIYVAIRGPSTTSEKPAPVASLSATPSADPTASADTIAAPSTSLQPSAVAMPSVVASAVPSASTSTTAVAMIKPTGTTHGVPAPTTEPTGAPAMPLATIASSAGSPPFVSPPPTATTTAPPPPTLTATATTTAPKPPPTAAPPTPVDVASATVVLGAIGTTNGVTQSQMRKALAPLPFLKCYRDALKIKGTAASGSATLSLFIDDTGHVTSATLKGADFLPGMRGCIEGAGRMAKVDVDTGDASATVTLQFSSK
ncbi:MAG: protein kinase [Polyangiales bacterium]